ncbi:hypothetical protein ACPYO6_08065 [Georgenia sp. Z1344]|uniref:hypothetical protein n=1 Tax=Georgenia sp. Z1344 TaxID=3416706 RepID=UPI003CF8C409
MRLEGEKPKRRRRPLPDAFHDASYDLRRVVERLERLAGDERLPRNRAALSEREYHDLARSREAIDRVLDILGEPSPTTWP